MRRFHLPILVLGVISGLFLAYLVLTVPPTLEDRVVLANVAYFFISLLVTLAVLLSFVIYFFNYLISKKPASADPDTFLRGVFKKSLRRGFLLSVAATGLVFLNTLHSLTLLNIILLLGIAVLIEMYFSSRSP
jgi:hypothetical protein